MSNNAEAVKPCIIRCACSPLWHSSGRGREPLHYQMRTFPAMAQQRLFLIVETINPSYCGIQIMQLILFSLLQSKQRDLEHLEQFLTKLGSELSHEEYNDHKIKVADLREHWTDIIRTLGKKTLHMHCICFIVQI